MKKLIIVLGILVAANVLVAQDHEKRMAEKKEELKERLSLTDEQAEQLQELREKYRPEMQSIRSDESKTRSEKLRAVADLVDQKDDELRTILNENQVRELSVIRNERRIKRQERRTRLRDRMKQRRK